MDDAEIEASRRRRAVYLLPNLFTTAGLFAGFYAIVAAMGEKFHIAAIAVIVAMLLDGIDGRVARMTGTQSDFGAQYDSMADLVSFGLAPALVMYKWSLVSMVELGGQWGKVGWLAAFFYAAMAAMRLARFNVQIGQVDKRYFYGLASPSAATLLVSFIWLAEDLDWSGSALWIPALSLTVIAGALMVSPVLYYSFKEVKRKDRIPYLGILLVVLALILVAIDPPKVIFAVFFAYAVSGPVYWLVRMRRKRMRHAHAGEPGADSRSSEPSSLGKHEE